MTKELVKIVLNKIGSETVRAVDARDLHAFLDVGKDFSTWIKERIDAYGFVDGQDFTCSPILGSKIHGGHNRIDYHLTIDMAKEVSMVERNEKGREIRRYFIECERRAKAADAIRPHIQRAGGQTFARSSGQKSFEEVISKLNSNFVKLLAAHEARSVERLHLVWREVNAVKRSIAAFSPAALAERDRQTVTRYLAAFRSGRSAAKIWRDAGLRPVKGSSAWLGNRLTEMGACIDTADLDVSVRRFDPHKAAACMANGLKARAERYITDKRGPSFMRLATIPEPPPAR